MSRTIESKNTKNQVNIPTAKTSVEADHNLAALSSNSTALRKSSLKRNDFTVSNERYNVFHTPKRGLQDHSNLRTKVVNLERVMTLPPTSNETARHFDNHSYIPLSTTYTENDDLENHNNFALDNDDDGNMFEDEELNNAFLRFNQIEEGDKNSGYVTTSNFENNGRNIEVLVKQLSEKFDNFIKFFTAKMATFETSIAELKCNYKSGNEEASESEINDITLLLPINSIEKFEYFNSRLEEENANFKDTFYRYLRKLGGEDPRTRVYLFMENSFDPIITRLYNWCGRKNKKCFSKNLMIETVLDFWFKRTNFDKASLIKEFKKYLKTTAYKMSGDDSNDEDISE